MTARRLRFLIAVISATILASTTSSAFAGDCCRQIGVGYSAGYNAPAPYACSQTCAKFPGWWGWKGACCHPGAAAPCSGSCAPTCGSCLPRCSWVAPCGGGCGCGACGCFGPPPAGIY